MSPVDIVALCVGLLVVGYVIYRVLEISALANQEAEELERQLIADRLARISEDKTR